MARSPSGHRHRTTSVKAITAGRRRTVIGQAVCVIPSPSRTGTPRARRRPGVAPQRPPVTWEASRDPRRPGGQRGHAVPSLGAVDRGQATQGCSTADEGSHGGRPTSPRAAARSSCAGWRRAARPPATGRRREPRLGACTVTVMPPARSRRRVGRRGPADRRRRPTNWRIVAGSEPQTPRDGHRRALGGGTIDASASSSWRGRRRGRRARHPRPTLITWAVTDEWREVPGLWTIPPTAGRILDRRSRRTPGCSSTGSRPARLAAGQGPPAAPTSPAVPGLAAVRAGQAHPAARPRPPRPAGRPRPHPRPGRARRPP